MKHKVGKTRAVLCSTTEQTLLMELYKVYKAAITKKGNTVAISKVRELAWQKIADRLNV